MARGLIWLSRILLLALAPRLGDAAFAAEPEPAEPAALSDASIESPGPEPALAPDWKGVRRDTYHFLGYQFAVLGLLYVMPTSVTNWEQDGQHLDKWWDNVTHPNWDEDAFYINYLLHPYWGATYYVRGRERNLSRWQSFGYSTLLSTLYEFGAEALFEKPSYQDLIVTPILGSLLGEFVFMSIRNSIKAKAGPHDTADRFLLVLTDPLGVVGEMINRLFGVQTQVSLTPFRAPSAWRSNLRPRSGVLEPAVLPGGPRFDPPRPRNPVWGLQLEVRW
jgi:hypothetical protein